MRSIVDFLQIKLQALWGLFDQFSKREKQAAAAAAAVVLVFFIDAAVLKPIQKNIVSLNQQILVQEKKFIHNTRSVEQKPQIDDLFSRLKQTVDLAPVSDEEARVSMLEDIEKYARERRIYLTEVKPQAPTQAGGRAEYRIRLVAEATMKDMLSFLADLVRTKKLYLVESLRIVPHPEDVNKIKATVAVNRVIFSH